MLPLQQLPTLPLQQMPKQLLQHMQMRPLRQSVRCKNFWCALQTLPGQKFLAAGHSYLFVSRISIGCHGFEQLVTPSPQFKTLFGSCAVSEYGARQP